MDITFPASPAPQSEELHFYAFKGRQMDVDRTEFS